MLHIRAFMTVSKSKSSKVRLCPDLPATPKDLPDIPEHDSQALHVLILSWRACSPATQKSQRLHISVQRVAQGPVIVNEVVVVL